MTKSRGISRLKGLRGPFEARFWSQVVQAEGCWGWRGATTGRGYGIMGRDGGRTAGLIMAHRASWEIHNGPIPAGRCVLHRCDNPPCTRPDHLWLGTRADNNRDMVLKGRAMFQKPDRFFTGRKLKAEQAVEIRRRQRQGELYADLARDFGVTHQTIGKIVRRETWPHAD